MTSDKPWSPSEQESGRLRVTSEWQAHSSFPKPGLGMTGTPHHPSGPTQAKVTLTEHKQDSGNVSSDVISHLAVGKQTSGNTAHGTQILASTPIIPQTIRSPNLPKSFLSEPPTILCCLPRAASQTLVLPASLEHSPCLGKSCTDGKPWDQEYRFWS